MSVLLLTGPPGAGKTTVAGLLAAAGDRAVHVEADRFFGFIGSGYIEPWRPEAHAQNTAVMDIVAGAAAGYADAGYFTIVEGILLPGWFLEPMWERLSGAGACVTVTVLRASLATCLARAAGRADDAVIERIWRGFEAPAPAGTQVVETGGRSAEQVAALVAAQIAGASGGYRTGRTRPKPRRRGTPRAASPESTPPTTR